MKTTIRLAKPVPVVFERQGRSREEIIGTVTFRSHHGEPEGVPSEEQVEEVWSVIDQTHRDRDELHDLDLRQGFVEAYIDAGFRATTYLEFAARHDAAGNVPVLDVTPFKARRMLLKDVKLATSK